MKPIAPNTLLQNRYLIVHLIGKGGMGEVYLAVDQRLGSAIALKRTFFSDDEQLGSAFEREARTLARLRHNVLPKVSDHFTEEGNQYLIMEHISGEDLSKRLETSKKPFPLGWVLFWADQLLDALNYLHSNEPPIIHRDIKPQNLKLTDDNSIVLLDFGLSKNSIDLKNGAPSTGSVVGYTPHYAPMEQIRGTGTDARSDLYSLSATLYQLLTNVVPSDALTRADALLSGTGDPLKPINETNPQVTPLISKVIARGMEVSQEKRFNTAREMQKALRDAYAQMQQNAPAVAAEPKKDALPPTPEILQSQIKTEVIPAPKNETAPILAQPDVQPTTSPVPVSKIEINRKSLPADRSTTPPTDFDATLPYNAKPSDLQTDSADAKTTDVSPADAVAFQKPEIVAEDGQKKPSAVAQADFSIAENSETAKKIDSTGNSFHDAPPLSVIVPKKKAENLRPPQPPPTAKDTAGFSAAPDFGWKTADSFETVITSAEIPRRNFQLKNHDAPAANKEAETAANLSAAAGVAEKKSGGKKGVFAAVGAGALLLVIAALGIGFYAVNSSKKAAVKSAPSPSATPRIAATPLSASAETTPDSQANADSTTPKNPTENATAETAANKAIDNQSTVKTAQPPTPAKVNPKPTAQTATTTTATTKPIIKPGAAAKSTPLPRILP